MCKYNEAHELIHTPINISCTTAVFCIKFYFFTSTVLLVSSFSFRMFVCSFFFFSVFKVKALREKVFFAITKIDTFDEKRANQYSEHVRFTVLQY